MITWINNCFANLAEGSSFQSARRRAVSCNWTSPHYDDITYILSSLKGKNLSINRKTALNTILAHLQNSSNYCEPQFQLKHLFLFDHSVDQLICLDQIGHYHNSSFFKLNSSSLYSQSIKRKNNLHSLEDFIEKYFLYIKRKAKFYLALQIADQLIKSKNQILRKQVLSLQNSKQLFYIISQSLKVTKMIFQLFKAQKHLLAQQKKSQLITQILTWALKSALILYVIISTSFMVLFKDLFNLSIKQLSQLYSLGTTYNNEFIPGFLLSLKLKNHILAFKNINYSQIQSFSSLILSSIKEIIKNKREKQGRSKNTNSTDKHEQKKKIPVVVLKSDNSKILMERKPRKVIQLQTYVFSIYDRCSYEFNQYKNYYHDATCEQDISTQSQSSCSYQDLQRNPNLNQSQFMKSSKKSLKGIQKQIIF